MATRIIIADDHPIVRSGIRTELKQHSEFELVGEATDGNKTLSLIQEIQPDLLILDINMPGIKAIEIIRQIKAQMLGCRILVLTAYGDAGTVLTMLKAGVDGYLLKEEDPQIISEAVHAVMNGKTWLSQSVLSIIVKKAGEIESSPEDRTLTMREKEVLALMNEGKKNREIAGLIHTSERTVEFHVSNIIRKMGVKSRLEAILQSNDNS